jgi:F0F1-type ATP synthase assembly protein I
MKNTLIAVMCSALLATSGCMSLTEDEASGAAVGGVLGAITAAALGANTEWLIIGTLAGAAAGALVARNDTTGECAYANGDGTYYTAPCP